MASIVYSYAADLAVDDVIALLNASTLGERRPVDNRTTIARMIRHANLLVTAWDGGKMVGFCRTLTDFDYVGYLSDLAVHADYQHQGIGKRLVTKTRQRMGPAATLVLLAAPKAVDYYKKIGFTRHDSAWVLRPTLSP